ncbi:hypothetical protein GW17_00060374 [Ensete ventricosum]|nr:hypothetical protein GW17_00060374 [Ensete ventricosum]
MGLVVADRPCRGLGRGWSPLLRAWPWSIALIEGLAMVDRPFPRYVRYENTTTTCIMILRNSISLHSLKLIFHTKTWLYHCWETSAKASYHSETDFPRRSNRYAKDWGLEKATKTDKIVSCDRLIT